MEKMLKSQNGTDISISRYLMDVNGSILFSIRPERKDGTAYEQIPSSSTARPIHTRLSTSRADE